MASQKVLIVDDSRMVRMQVQDMLPKGNIEILEAGDGVEGFDLVAANHPNLVLIDFFMPRMNGWEVVQKMQLDPKLQAIPVVMMSGRKEDVMAAVPELFDYFEFLNKPFDAAVLMKAIKAAMAKAKNRSPLPPILMAATPQAPAAPSGTGSTADDMIRQLQAEIQDLRKHNATLQQEVGVLKKQMNQIITVIRQKLK